MVILEEEDVNPSDGSRERKPTYLQIASLLHETLLEARAGVGDGANPTLTQILEFAAQEFGIERDEDAATVQPHAKKAKRGKAVQPPQLTCDHSCCHHSELMNPNPWSALPPDLLQLVFVRLPVDEISHLQLLSKDWKRTLANPGSEFYRNCAEVQPKMLCLITRDSSTKNKFWVRVLDVRSEWRTYRIVAGYPEYLHWAPECADGGLICFAAHLNDGSASIDARPTVFLNIVNPLKRVLQELPPVCLLRGGIFQMKVDRQTQAFKLFVVAERLRWANLGHYNGSMWMGGGVTAQIFDSVTQKWTSAHETSDFVFGFRHKQTWAYDCADGGRFLHLPGGDDSPLNSEFVGSARHEDHLFVLRMGTSGPANDEPFAKHSATYYIEEFRYQMQGSSWVKSCTHRCIPFERPPKKPLQYFMRLFACDGLLVVFAELTPFHVQGRFGNKLGWRYDLATREWRVLALPQLPIGKKAFSDESHDPTYSVDLVCKPHWLV